MITRTLAHRVPTVTFNVTIVVEADKTLLFIAGLAWLAWLYLACLGRFCRGIWAWITAAGRVVRRRWRNWKRETMRRIEWQLSGLVYGSAMGVG